MKETDLKQLLDSLGIPMKEFMYFIIGKTFSTIDNEHYFHMRDITSFLKIRKAICSTT